MYQISQRRYLGNKNSILPFIDEIINKNIGSFYSLCDIFSGTGVVGSYYNCQNKKIICNDLLYHNFISLNAFLNNDEFNYAKVIELIESFNIIHYDKLEENYFSINFGNKYFSNEIAKKIGFIRESIRELYLNNTINQKEKYILITSLIYSVDRIANTVGHYDAFIKKDIKTQRLELKMIDTTYSNNVNNEIYNKDANVLIRDIECDILYLDPPYNSRQYCDAYHLLENLALWNKPKLYGVAKKFDRSKIKSEYNKTNATKSFDDLIQNAKCKYILFSYNNMADKGNHRSNAKISDSDILKILSKRGKIEVYEKEYKEYTTGKSNRGDNSERIFFLEVR